MNTNETSLTLTNLTSGRTYKFVIAAKNSIGTSNFTSELSIFAATVPDPPKSITRDNANINTT
jgi:hypothetical protein